MYAPGGMGEKNIKKIIIESENNEMYVFGSVTICIFKIFSISIFTEISKKPVNFSISVKIFFGIPRFRYKTVYQKIGMSRYIPIPLKNLVYQISIWYR